MSASSVKKLLTIGPSSVLAHAEGKTMLPIACLFVFAAATPTPTAAVAPYLTRVAAKDFKVEAVDLSKGWPKGWGALDKSEALAPVEVERVALKRTKKEERKDAAYFAELVLERWVFTTAADATRAHERFTASRKSDELRYKAPELAWVDGMSLMVASTAAEMYRPYLKDLQPTKP